jgi:BlaI family transcriptional regulator, penicillinase repressor
VLWQSGQATVREICKAINRQGESLAYTTVLSLLQVMEQKGLVGHRSAGKVYSYFAKVERGATVRALARGFLDRVFDGAVDEYLVGALESKRPSADEIRRLEDLILQAKQARQSSRRKGGKEASK